MTGRRSAALLVTSLTLAACTPARSIETGPGGTPAPSAAGAVRSPELARPQDVGMSAGGLARVDSIIEAAIADHATPGAAVAIGRRGKLVRLRGYGRLDYRPGFGAATDSTLYDLASLSKVIGTTTAAMLLVEAGTLDLDRTVASYLPELSGDVRKNAVTVRQLLLHTSGFPAFLPLYTEARGRERYLRRIDRIPFEYAPGTRTVYSDFNLILTALIVERLTGRTLDALLRDRVYGPLHMRDTGYNPLAPLAPIPADTDCTAPYRPDAPLLARIAPTEIDTIYRHRHIHGIVHDENACAIGGVSGHAGLFSSARDLAVFAQMMLNGGEYGGVRVLHARTIDGFTARQGPASTRGLGWDTPGDGVVPDGFSPRSFGHTGFTGTSIWVDPSRQLFVVLLTNRVNPTRDNQKIVPLRRAVAGAVLQAVVGDGPEKAVQK